MNTDRLFRIEQGKCGPALFIDSNNKTLAFTQSHLGIWEKKYEIPYNSIDHIELFKKFETNRSTSGWDCMGEYQVGISSHCTHYRISIICRDGKNTGSHIFLHIAKRG